MNGGPPQPLFEVPPLLEMLYCTNRVANFCAYPSRTRDGRSWVIRLSTPSLANEENYCAFRRSPGPIPLGSFSDGSQVAILKTDWNTGQIRFIPLGGEEPRTVTVRGYVNLDSLDWAPDSRSVFVPGDRAAPRCCTST